MNVANRVLFTVVGLAALLVGAAGLSVSGGWMSVDRLDGLTRHRDLWEWWLGIDWTDTRLAILAVIALVVAIVAAVIAVREVVVRREPSARLVVVDHTDRGITTVRTKALRRALAHDAESVEGVDSARIDLDVTAAPVAVVDVRAGADGDLTPAAREVRERMSRGIANVLGREAGRIDVRVDLGRLRPRPSKTKVVL